MPSRQCICLEIPHIWMQRGISLPCELCELCQARCPEPELLERLQSRKHSHPRKAGEPVRVWWKINQHAFWIRAINQNLWTEFPLSAVLLERKKQKLQIVSHSGPIQPKTEADQKPIKGMRVCKQRGHLNSLNSENSHY